MAFYYLLTAITIDNRFQAFKSSAPHEVSHTFLLNAKSLNLIIDVEKKRVISR